jgi:hypothetical protein
MSQKRIERDASDPMRKPSDPDYLVHYLAIRYDLSADEARALLAKHGEDWKALTREAEAMDLTRRR